MHRALILPLNCLHNITKMLSFICISSYHLCLFTGSFPCLSWPLTARYPSLIAALRMQAKDKHQVFSYSQSDFPVFWISFQSLFHSPTSPHVHEHVPSISSIPQSTEFPCMSIEWLFTRRLQLWLHQGLYCAGQKIINVFITCPSPAGFA